MNEPEMKEMLEKAQLRTGLMIVRQHQAPKETQKGIALVESARVKPLLATVLKVGKPIANACASIPQPGDVISFNAADAQALPEEFGENLLLLNDTDYVLLLQRKD